MFVWLRMALENAIQIVCRFLSPRISQAIDGDVRGFVPAVCEELDPYMIFCLAHFQNLPQLSKVTEFNTDLNTRDRQTSSNVCLLKLKEKQQHIKNAIRSQSMASLSQVPVLNFSVCKKGKQKNASCTLDCNNPQVPLHTKGLYLYKSSENVYNKFNCKKISPPPFYRPPKSAFMHS